jgi:signal transduction histidine kinase
LESEIKQNQNSLINTLFVRLILTSLGVAVLIFCLFYYNLSITRDSLHDRGLVSQARDIANYLETGEDGELKLQLSEELKQTYISNNDFLYIVLDKSEKVLFSSNGQIVPLYPPNHSEAPNRPDYFQITAPGTREKITGVTMLFEVLEQQFIIQVTQGASHKDVLVDSILEEFSETTGALIALLIFFILLINVMTIRRAMKPLKNASQLASDINPAHLDVRLPENHIPVEILPLVQAVNAALERLEKGFQMQRDFTADAAHQLRTPLSILSARIDKLSANEEYDALKSDIRAMTRIVGQLLKVAQLEIFILDEMEQADLSAICIDVAAEIGPLAIKQKKSISVIGADQPIIVKGNTESLHHAVLNLVENALMHTPGKTSVEIEVNAKRVLKIRDYGPGIAPEHHIDAFQRFWRADKDSSGAGLGLAIVSRIIEVHHGHVNISDGTEHSGCEIVITLP